MHKPEAIFSLLINAVILLVIVYRCCNINVVILYKNSQSGSPFIKKDGMQGNTGSKMVERVGGTASGQEKGIRKDCKTGDRRTDSGIETRAFAIG